MQKSMTGYGQCRIENDRFTAIIEIKSLNSKFLDANFRLPKAFSDKEVALRNLLTQKVIRGKVGFSLEYQPAAGAQTLAKINKEAFTTYFNELTDLASSLNTDTSEIFRICANMPSVIETKQEGVIEEEDWNLIQNAINEALAKFEEFRTEEGTILQNALSSYIDTIWVNLVEIEKYDPQRIEGVRQRISEKINEIKKDLKIDENRLEQELIYYIEKLDINEEKVRLKKHLEHFKEVVNASEAQGKKLGFISQEIGREINTIGSKAQDADIQKLVVNMKEELEKIKEQSLNLL